MLNHDLSGTGLEVNDAEHDVAFQQRQLHARDIHTQMEGLWRLFLAFIDSPETIFQELADSAIDLCGADSAGVSVEQRDHSEMEYWLWTATAGEFAQFRNCSLPRYPSACAACVEQGRAKTIRVTQRFYDLVHIKAPEVTDGLMVPWQVGAVRGTIWIVAHGREAAFDREDLKTIETLAHFASEAKLRHHQRRLELERETLLAVAAMSKEYSDEIDDLLRSLPSVTKPELKGLGTSDAEWLAAGLKSRLRQLAMLVEQPGPGDVIQ